MMPEVIAGGSSRPKFVSERAAWCALHDRLIAAEGDLAAASRRNIEVGFANQKRPEFGLAESAEELREPALRQIEFERFLVLPMHLHRDILLCVFGHRGVHGSPSAARAAVDAFANRGEQQLRPVAQRLLDRASAAVFPISIRSARSTGTSTWA